MAEPKTEYYVQVSGWGTKGESQFQKVDGEPVIIKGAEDADLFIHRPLQGEGWKISSGINGMYVAWGSTKKEALADVQQKGKPEAITRGLKEYLDSGQPVSPGHKTKSMKAKTAIGLPKGLSITKVAKGWEVIHTKSGNRLMPFAYPERKLAVDFATRAGQVADWTRPLKDLQSESENLADLIRGGKKPGMFETAVGMPTTFPTKQAGKPNRKPLRDMTKTELKKLRVILHILPDGILEIKEKGADSLERQVASWNPPNRPDRTEKSWVGGYISSENVADNAKKWLDIVAKKYDLDMDEIVADSWRGGGMRHKASPYSLITNTFTGKVKTVSGSDMTVGKTTDLQSIHDSRSPRSRESDERQSNADTIEPDDPRVSQWLKDQGRMDVRGIDTPGKKRVGSKRAKSKPKRRSGMNNPTSVRGIRR